MKIKKLALAAALPLAMMVAAPAQAADTWFIIDDFNTGSFYSVEDTSSSNGEEVANAMPVDGTNIVMSDHSAVGPTIPSGWTRSISADLISGDSTETQICNNCQAGHLASGAAGSVGNADFTYSGSSTLDLTGGPGYTDWWITFDYAADHDGAIVAFTFTDSGNNSATFSSNPLANTNFNSDITDSANRTQVKIDWPMGTSVNYESIKEVRIDILGVSDLDFSIDNAMTHHVPEPATFALMGLGLAGLGWKKRRAVATK